MSWKEAGEELSPTPVSALMVAQGLGSLVGSWGQLWTPAVDSPHRVIATDPEARAEEGGCEGPWTLAGTPMTRGAGQREGGWPGGGPGLLPGETRSIAPAAERLLPEPPAWAWTAVPAGLGVQPGRAGPLGEEGSRHRRGDGSVVRGYCGGQGGLCALGPPASPSPGVPPPSPSPPGQFKALKGHRARGPPQRAPYPEARASRPGGQQSRAPNPPRTPSRA